MANLDSLIAQIERQRIVVDADLFAPAEWTGTLRRLAPRQHSAEDTARYARAFNGLLGDTRGITVAWLQELHASVFGDGALRASKTSIGSYGFPAASELADLVAVLLEEIGSSTEPVVLRASRLHLRLMLIHPFADGNGRTARLAASYLLIREGFRSTLFTAVEQHFLFQHRQYGESLRALRDGVITEDEWHGIALEAMANRSDWVCNFRLRQERLRTALAQAGVPQNQHEREMVGFDFGTRLRGRKLRALLPEQRPWRKIQDAWTPFERSRFHSQLSRLISEEEIQPHKEIAHAPAA